MDVKALNKLRLGVQHLPQRPEVGQEIELSSMASVSTPASGRSMTRSGESTCEPGELILEMEEI